MLLMILLISVIFFCIYWITARPANFPPGPLNLPLVGYLPFLEQNTAQQMMKLSQKYGDVIGLRFGSYWVVMLSSLESVREAFKEDVFSGRPMFPIFRMRASGKGILLSEGHNWQEMRRFTLRNLRDFGLGKSSLEGLIQAEIRELINNMQGATGKPIVLTNRFNLAIVNALWTLMGGIRFPHDDPEAVKSIENISKIIANSSNRNVVEFIPFLSHFGPWKANISNRMRNIEFVWKFVTEAIKTHQDSHVEGDESDLIHSFLEAMQNNSDPESPLGLDGMLNLKNVIYDLYFAGAETTATSLLWLILLLASYPQIQEKIHREIDKHVPADELPSTEHRKKLTYTEATIRESMRFASLAPLGVFHSTLHNTKFRGYDIPKDTILFGNLYQIHHDPKYWEKPNEFYPEHFLTPDGSLRTPEAFVPFGIGKRTCLGETLARAEMYLFATALLQKFTFKFPVDQPPPSLEPKITTLYSPQPFEVIVELRN